MSEGEEPLLVEGEDVEWDRIEEGPSKGAVTVQQLISQDPDNVIKFIKERGVSKLGEFQVPDYVVLSALGDRSMLTIGQDTYDIDYETVWRQELAKAKKRRKVDTTWSRMVTVEAFVVNIKNAAAPDKEGLVQPLLKRWQMGACSYSVFGLPALQAVLDFKWNTFARKALYMELACFLVWLLSFSVFGLVFQDEDVHMSLADLWSTTTGKVTLVCEALAVLAMTPFVIIEVSTLAAYSWYGWINLWNVLDISNYALQVAIVVIHLSRTRSFLESTSLSVLVATQCVLLWFRLNYFSRVFISSASSFVDSIRQVVVDIKFYLLFLMLMMWGFAVSFCILFRQDQEFEQFSDITHSMLTMFSYALGGVELDIMLASRNPKAAVSLSILYQFAMSMVLMNLLIGIMTTSMEKATKNEDLKLLLSKAEIIDELEATIPKWVERRLPHFYPAYVHVLRVDPKSEEPAPDAAHMWQRQATIRSERTPPPAASSSSDMSAVMSELDTLKRQMQHLNDLLSTAVPSLPSSPGAHTHSIMSESSE